MIRGGGRKRGRGIKERGGGEELKEKREEEGGVGNQPLLFFGC